MSKASKRQTYELLELSGAIGEPELILDVLSESDDYEELQHVADSLTVESFGTRGPGSMSKQRFAVRPSLGSGQEYLQVSALIGN
jgi:hypothetical protein